MGKINFIERFIPNYDLIVKPINKLPGNDQYLGWTPKAQRAFANIKLIIVSSLILASPNFGSHFILYSFASKYTMVVVLTQHNQKGEELPISFMSKEMHDYDLRYSPLEKKAFSLVKVVAHFRP